MADQRRRVGTRTRPEATVARSACSSFREARAGRAARVAPVRLSARGDETRLCGRQRDALEVASRSLQNNHGMPGTVRAECVAGKRSYRTLHLSTHRTGWDSRAWKVSVETGPVGPELASGSATGFLVGAGAAALDPRAAALVHDSWGPEGGLWRSRTRPARFLSGLHGRTATAEEPARGCAPTGALSAGVGGGAGGGGHAESQPGCGLPPRGQGAFASVQERCAPRGAHRELRLGFARQAFACGRRRLRLAGLLVP